MTRRDAYIALKKQLEPYSGESAAAEAQFMLEHLCGIGRTELLLHGEVELPAGQAARLFASATRRVHGEPLQYITGKADFMGMTLKVGPGVLIPRSDTEFAVACAADLLRDCTNPVVEDLCSGTGCIALALERELCGGTFYAVEWEETAYSYLLENITVFHSRVRPLRADVTKRESAALLGACDLIISNPPYIKESERELMGRDVLEFEPVSALFAEEDGLFFYRKIIENYLPALKPGGYFVFEIGFSQGAEVSGLLRAAGLQEITVHRDFSGNDRVVSARKKSEAVTGE